MNNYVKILGFCLLSLGSLSIAFATGSPIGRWKTIDDKSGEKRAIVELFVSNGVLNGKIVETFPHPGESTVCTNCPGKFKDKTIKGLEFMWGLEDKGRGVWEGGRVLDAKSGKIYHVKLKVHQDKLYVRGYIGMAMLGRTQVWIR